MTVLLFETLWQAIANNSSVWPVNQAVKLPGSNVKQAVEDFRDFGYVDAKAIG